MKSYVRLLPFVLLSWGALALQAQEDNLDPVRTKTDITDADRGQIRAFVGKRVARIVANDPTDARLATADLIKNCAGTDQVKSTDPFKKAYAAVCIEAVGAEYKAAEVVPATRLLTVLNTFNMAEAQPVLIEALGDSRAGVRAAGAIGLRNLRDKIAAGGAQACEAVLNALKEAGKKEKSADTLKSFYNAMNYVEMPNPPELRMGAPALLELLEERARQYAAGQVQAFGSDDAGLRLALLMAKAVGDEERKRLAGVAGTLMKYALEQYTSGERKLSAVRDSGGNPQAVELRNDMERIILTGEQLLAAVVPPPLPTPTVSDGMKKAEPTDMKNAWRKWVDLLQKTVGRNFALVEQPESAPAPPEGDTKGGDEGGE